MQKNEKKVIIGILMATIVVLGFFLSIPPEIDELVVAEAEKQGISKENLELVKDYGTESRGESPYVQIYKDKKSDKHFAVISQLPMVNARGEKIEPNWKVSGRGFVSDTNIFSAEAKGTETALSVLNDQADGREIGDSLSFMPELFLNDVEQEAVGPVLLEKDPLNENYNNNTLEWDYGIAKRRLRIIEGSLLGSWVFNENPNGEARIKYNQEGDFRLMLGEYALNEDEESVSSEMFDNALYPFVVGDTVTFYPDTNQAGVDGWVRRGNGANGVQDTWPGILSGVGTEYSSSTYYVAIGLSSCGADYVNKWDLLFRGIFVLDTSGIPDDAIISGATLSVYGWAKVDEQGSWAPDVNVYSSSPSSNTSLSASDYSTLGATAFSDSPISYVNWSTGGWNNFELNAAGKSAISTTGVTKLGLRMATKDVGGTEPTPWQSSRNAYLYAYASEQGEGYKPKLVVTYSLPSVPTVTTQAASDILNTTAVGNGNITNTGGASCDLRGVRWGATSGVYTSSSTNSGSFDTGAFTKTMTGLDPGITYYYQAMAHNSAGWGYGGEASFATQGYDNCLSHDVTGYAWSDNTGWLSFSCENHWDIGEGYDYGVDISDEGVFSGYAWSDDVGWIYMAPSTGYPASPNHGVQVDGAGSVTGWARVCSVFESGCSGDLKSDIERGGWDGWMEMSGAQYHEVEIDYSDDSFSGYSWDDIGGWSSFDGVLTLFDLGSPPDKILTGSMSVSEQNGCSYVMGMPILSWVYSDDDNDPVGTDPQRAYEVRIATNTAAFAGDFNAANEFSCSGVICSENNDSVSFSPLAQQWIDWADFGETYHWMVRVKDSTELWSEWSESDSSSASAHTYPEPDFSFSPNSPSAGEEVTFTDLSVCYNSLNNPVNCRDTSARFIWDFGDGVLCDSNTNPACKLEYATHTFSESLDYPVSLEVTDIGSCSTSTLLETTLPLPDFKEVEPFSFSEKLMAGLNSFKGYFVNALTGKNWFINKMIKLTLAG
jgi:hypothetical protein